MAKWISWEINCETCGQVFVWSASETTECPNDAGHTFANVVSPNPAFGALGVHDRIAFDTLRMTNGTDVYEYTIDVNGDWVKTKLT